MFLPCPYCKQTSCEYVGKQTFPDVKYVYRCYYIYCNRHFQTSEKM